MSKEQKFKIAKAFLKETLGLQADQVSCSQHALKMNVGNLKVSLIAEGRRFEVYMDWANNEIRLTEIHLTKILAEDKYQTFIERSPEIKDKRKPWVILLRYGHTKFFDTMHDMHMALDSDPEMARKYVASGPTEEVMKYSDRVRYA